MKQNTTKSKRILLGQLGLNGDCLHMTVVARQIKHDYPNCHLTWAISSACRSVIEENPYIDVIWEIPASNWNEMFFAWRDYFEQEVNRRVALGEFDEVFLTQIYPNNAQNFDGTTRVSHYRGYPHPITVPLQNVLRLKQEEVNKTKQFVEQNQITKYQHVILFECSSSSSQSFVTPEYALEVAHKILSQIPDCSIILSSNRKFVSQDKRIIDGSALSLRENAELTKYCSLFVGCSSGITQVASTDWAKPLPMIQLLSGATSVYASVVHDLEYWKQPTSHILEMADTPSDKLVECICVALTEGFTKARTRFHQQIPLDFSLYLHHVRSFMGGNYSKIAQSLLHTIRRYGLHSQLQTFIKGEFTAKTNVLMSPANNEQDYVAYLEKYIHSQGQKIVKNIPYIERNLQQTSRLISIKIEPLVSICIPVYNGEKFLLDTLDSVLAQTYNNIEVILSDDNSGDNSLEIAKKYQTKSNCNFVILLHKPCGMVQNWNFCVEHTKGKYIKFLHQDDVLEPDCIEKMVALAEQDDEISLVFSPRGIIASNEAQNDPVCQADIHHSKNLHGSWQNLQSIQDGQTLLLAPNILDNPINKIGEPTTVLIKKEVFDSIGFFDTELCQLVDVEMWFRIMSQYKIGFVDQILSHWRIHSQQQTRSNSKNRERILLDWQKFYQKIFENEIYPAQLREKVASVLGYATNANNQNYSLSKPQNIAQKWLDISEENLESAFSGELGNKHRELLASGIKQLLFSSEEKQFIVELNQHIAKGWKQDKIAQHFLSASLYCYPHQLPEKWFENAEVPEFLVDYFVNFMFETPSFFKELDEADQYCHYVKKWVDFLHLCITIETDSPIWQQMAWVFAQRANFIPLYFNSQNLKEIYVKRAEIMEIALKQQGFQIDFNFPKRDQNRKKIRVGFLSNHFTPLTETFSTLPAFEYLDRGFEVVLYANVVSGHSLEKYCESRVDRLVQLPEDLNAKVQMIRQDDLDFLFICTNTTAVTNQITILALHKLARVQIATFNSPVTTGMKNIDYYLTGKLTEFGNSDHYSEKLLLLDGQGYCFNYGDNEPKPTQIFTRQLFDIKEEQTIFISAANFYKLTPELKETWVKILAGVTNSVLILMPFGQSWSNQYPKESLIKSLHLLFEKYNISIDRLKFFDPLPNRIEVREALKIADVYLDSYPYSGTTSLIEPLEIGLPSVVRQGNTLRNRMGAAMLQSIHLNNLVVENEESYIELAVKLGTNADLRTKYRGQILEKMANNPPFLDSKTYSAQIGEVLKQLFKKHIQ